MAQNHSTTNTARLQAARASRIQAIRDSWDRIGLPHADLSDDQLYWLAIQAMGLMHLLGLDPNNDASWQQMFKIMGARALVGGVA